MNLTLRSVTIAEALQHEAFLERGLSESSEALEEELEPGTARRVLDVHAQAPETVVLFAEDPEAGRPVALCISVPLVDPLRDLTTPLIVACYVEPDLRARGIARALVNELSRVLAGRTRVAPAVRVGHNDDALISMGERWGFVRHWEWMARD